MSSIKYNLANILVVSVTSIVVYLFDYKFINIPVVAAAICFQIYVAQKYYRYNKARTEYTFIIIAIIFFVCSYIFDNALFYSFIIASILTLNLFGLSLYLKEEEKENTEKINKTVEESTRIIKIKNQQLANQNEQQKNFINKYEVTIKNQAKDIDKYKTIISKQETLIKDLKLNVASLEEENTVLEKIIEEIKRDLPEEYKNTKAALMNQYKNIKNPKVFDFLTTGELHYSIWASMSKGDYSPIVVEYAKSVETLFKDVLKAKGLYKNKDETRPLAELIREYVDKEKYAAIWDNNFKDKLNQVRELRNPAAHVSVSSLEDVEKIRKIILGDKGKQGLIAYMNKLL